MGQTRPQTLYFKEEKSQDNIKSSFGVLGGPKVTSWADSYNQQSTREVGEDVSN